MKEEEEEEEDAPLAMLARFSAHARARARAYLPRFRSGALPRAPCVSYFRAALNEPYRRPYVYVYMCARARARCVCVCVRVYAPTSLPSKQVEQTAVVSRRGLSACARETSARCARSPAEGERVVAQGRKNSSNNPDSAEISLRYPVSLRFRST